MFFSAKQYSDAIAKNSSIGTHVAAFFNKRYTDERGNSRYDTRNLTQKEIRQALRSIKKQIVERNIYMKSAEGTDTGMYVSKFLRPWEIVPELMNYSAPEGDYGVGVEVEMGFTSTEAAQMVAAYIANWKNVCLDFEGGEYPIEATFPPSKYSTFGKRSQVARYLDYLKQNEHLCVGHGSSHRMVGTHVNVSKGGLRVYDMFRCDSMSRVLSNCMSTADNLKYFGRTPYGYIYRQVGYLEFKLFKSTLDSARVIQYVDIAVALTELVTSILPITETTVRAALEAGFNKRAKAVAPTSVPTVPALPLAA